MKILHTSDWHLGRTFFAHPTFEPAEQVFAAMAQAVAEHQIDVVLAAGDIFDLSTPSAEAFEFLDRQLLRLREAGARVVLTPGNHDSAARLGARRAFAAAGGVHVLTDAAELATPVTIEGVHFYGIPFLEPAVMRTGLWQEVSPMRSQRDAITHAMTLIRADAAARGGAAVVLAHTFVQGADGESCESERDITGASADVHGIDKVPVSAFDGVTYAALGHIHGRAVLAEHVRYCGAPLHFSFSEATKPRGGWIVEIDEGQLVEVTWLDLPIPRRLSTLRGTLDTLLSDPAHGDLSEHWVSATLTDQARPIDAMAELQRRFPHCVQMVWQPPTRNGAAPTYAQALATLTSDEEIIDAFLADVRNGLATSDEERALIGEIVAAVRSQEAAR